MRAICRTGAGTVELREISRPNATPEHVVIKTTACGINPGDKALIAGLFPEVPVSQHDICGGSASGIVIAVGEGVPPDLLGRKVTVYRSLKASQDCVGTWSEFSRMHYLTCVPLPDEADEADYAASLVSVITAYLFLEQILADGHKAVICTAGTSATGRALLGVCLDRGVPIISIVPSDAGRQTLARLDAQHILARNSHDFDAALAKISAQIGATAVFDGVGGLFVGRVAKALPPGSTIFCYGFLAGPENLDFPSSLLLLKDLTVTSFSVLRPLVRDDATLQRLIAGVQDIIGMPHFHDQRGEAFPLENAAAALAWQGRGKPVLRP